MTRSHRDDEMEVRYLAHDLASVYRDPQSVALPWEHVARRALEHEQRAVDRATKAAIGDQLSPVVDAVAVALGLETGGTLGDLVAAVTAMANELADARRDLRRDGEIFRRISIMTAGRCAAQGARTMTSKQVDLLMALGQWALEQTSTSLDAVDLALREAKGERIEHDGPRVVPVDRAQAPGQSKPDR